MDLHLVADYPRLRFTFRCDLEHIINLICIVLHELFNYSIGIDIVLYLYIYIALREVHTNQFYII